MASSLIIISFFLPLTFAPCSDRSCTGPYKLNNPTNPTMTTSNERHQGLLSIARKTVPAVIGYRSRYTAYCYQGGLLDPNTGCKKTHDFKPPTASDLERWAKDSTCEYGLECPVGGECWGSGANSCLDEKLDYNRAHKKEYNGNNQEWMVFPHHSCVSTWRCGVEATEFPLHLRRDDKGVATYTYDRHGSEIQLNQRWQLLDQETSVVFTLNTGVTQLTVDLNCYGEKGVVTVCQLPDVPQLEDLAGDSIEIDVDGFGTIRNVLLMININETHPDDLKNNGKKGVSKNSKHKSLAQAASIEDVKLIISSMVYESSETNYNAFQLLTGLNELKQKLNTVIESVSKLDDELIGRLLGLQAKTKWFNDKIFHLCPCFQVNMPPNSNCMSDFVFRDGRFQAKKKTDQCVDFGSQAVQPINITSNTNIVVSSLSFPPPQGTSADWDGWSWLAREKEGLIDSMLFHNEVTNPGSGNPLSQIYNETLGGFTFWSIISKGGPFISLVALILSVYNFCKK